MLKVAIILLADTSSPGDMGRMANALTTAQEFLQAGDEVALVFDGAATKWIGTLAKPDHKYHDAFEKVRGNIKGVCSYCANAFKVADEVKAAGIELTSEFEGHPSLRSFVKNGFTILSF